MGCLCWKAAVFIVWTMHGIRLPPAILSGCRPGVPSGLVRSARCERNISFIKIGIAIRLQRGIMNRGFDKNRLAAESDEPAAIAEPHPPAVTRIVFTPTDM